MKIAIILSTGLVFLIVAFAVRRALAFERLYDATPTGEIEVKELPERRALSAQGDGDYFQRDDGLFMTLFDYIKKNDVAMTTPVEAEIDSAEMRFFVGSDRAEDALESTASVNVVPVPARVVVSVGLKGAYSKENFVRGQKALDQWLGENPEWTALETPYAVYWDGPYVPVPLRRSEVHVRIEPTPAS